jgi:hypothetical protein
MTTELKATLADHAAGNYRVLMNLSDELLAVAVAAECRNTWAPKLFSSMSSDAHITQAPSNPAIPAVAADVVLAYARNHAAERQGRYAANPDAQGSVEGRTSLACAVERGHAPCILRGQFTGTIDALGCPVREHGHGAAEEHPCG